MTFGKYYKCAKANFCSLNLNSQRSLDADFVWDIQVNVVYCSIGVRSEKIGEKLQAAGYTNVKNLYGGIFQWKGEGEKVVDSLGLSTERVHAFSKLWGKLLTNAKKVY